MFDKNKMLKIIEQAMHRQLWRITLELCDSQLILSLTIHACRSLRTMNTETIQSRSSAEPWKSEVGDNFTAATNSGSLVCSNYLNFQFTKNVRLISALPRIKL